ncbi:MAG TPA: lytic murein transglycosylase [Alphaproteobacteria bacterium]|nr:lytic murein transglycosylase [Alphaproteobacteria bacterium]
MQKHLGLLFVVLLAGCANAPSEKAGTAGSTAPSAANADFTRFYKQFRATLSPSQAKLFTDSFNGNVVPYRVAQKAARSQPELTKTFEEYVGPMLKAERVSVARARLEENRDVLEQIALKTGVPPEVVIALWGIETNFGNSQGKHPVIPALATLAWESHRQEFYQKELHAALDLTEQNNFGPDIKGSWAGALGQPQFMPSTYLRAGVDGDGDGRVDLFNDLPDVFASTANLLKLNGWKRGLAWRITLPENAPAPNLKLNERGLSEPFDPSGYKLAGIAGGEKYRYYRPTSGPAFLLGPNFTAVLRWNNSSYFAYSVLALADMLKD